VQGHGEWLGNLDVFGALFGGREPFDLGKDGDLYQKYLDILEF
jgi:hypothetical protein